MNVSSSSIRSHDRVLCDHFVNFCLFVFVEACVVRVTSQQLSKWRQRARINTDTDKSFLTFFTVVRRYNSCRSRTRRYICAPRCSMFHYLLFVIDKLKVVFLLTSTALISCIIRILLLRGGIESNPGPGHDLLGDRFQVQSQNCRGLTDRNKLFKVLKKLYPRHCTVSPVIACLQETHCLDKFAIKFCFKGVAVIDIEIEKGPASWSQRDL